MKLKIKPAFYRLGSKQNKKGLAPIYARIKQQGTKLVNISTGIWLHSSEWDAKKKQPKRNTPRLNSMYKLLQEFEDKIYETEREIEKEKKKVTPDEIKYRLTTEKVQHTLLTLFDYHISDMEKREGRGTQMENIKRYKTTKNKIVEFLKSSHYRCSDIPLERLDYNFIIGYDAFMAERYNNSISTRHKNTQRLRTVISTGEKLGWIVASPFASYKGKTAYRKRQYLTQQELNSIEDLDLSASNQLDIARDLFLFMCYTGVSYVDLKALVPDDLCTSGKGNLYIQFDRSKTGTLCTAYLSEITRCIIEKYRSHPACLNKGRLLPVPPNQSMNRMLKTIACRTGIKKPTSCHVGRHTFATLALNEWGIPIETVSKLLGHKSIKTTMIYLLITPAKTEEDCLQMVKTVNNRKSKSRIA